LKQGGNIIQFDEEIQYDDSESRSEPSISDAFNNMFKLYFGNFIAFFVFLLIFQGGIALLNIMSSAIGIVGIPFIGSVFNIAGALLSALSVGGLVAMATEEKMKGETSMSKGFSLIGKKAWSIIAIGLIVGIAVFVGICLCIIPAFFALYYLLWALVIVVVETADVGSSLSRSVDFAKRHQPVGFIFAYIGLAIVFGIMQFTVSFVPQLTIFFGGLTLLGSGMNPALGLLIITMVSAIITIPIAALFGPFLPIFMTDYYLQTKDPSEPMLAVEKKRPRGFREDLLDW
jgi:hypothetical protein